MTRLFFILVLAVTAANAQTPKSLPAVLALSQAIDIALQNSSRLREAQANLETKSGQYEQARAALLPQLDLAAHQSWLTINLQGLGLDILNQPNLIGPFGSMDARVILRQDLLNIASIRSWQSYSSRRDSARFLVENSREAVALNVIGAYLDALRAKASRDTLAEQARLANQLYELTADRFRQGAAAELDANRAKQTANSIEERRMEAEQGLVASKLNLANLLQADITDNFDVSDQAAYGSGEAPDRSATLQAALAARPDYRAASAAVRAAELNIKSIEATRLPSLRMRLGDGQSGNSPVHNVNTYDLAGILDVPIFTGGRIRGEVHEAEGALREATAAMDKDRAQIETDVLTAISGIDWALKQVELSGQNVGLSRQELELTRARFLQGVADNSEVVDAQDRLSRAADAQIRSQYTLGLARANLARATGVAEHTYRK